MKSLSLFSVLCIVCVTTGLAVCLLWRYLSSRVLDSEVEKSRQSWRPNSLHVHVHLNQSPAVQEHPFMGRSDLLFTSLESHAQLASKLDDSLDSIRDGTCTTRSTSGYILADIYSDQLNMAMLHFIQLVEIASHWNMTVVEPHVLSDRLTGLRGMPFAQRSKFLSFRDVFNVSLFHRQLDTCLELQGNVPICSFQHFLANSGPKFLALRFVREKNKPRFFTCHSLELLSAMKRLNLLYSGGRIHTLNHSLVARHYGSFKGLGTLCVNGLGYTNTGTSLINVLTKKLNHLRESGTNIFISQWSLIQNKFEKSAYFYDPNLPWTKYHGCTAGYPVSRRIAHATDVFAESLYLSHPIMGIHIRVERIGLEARRNHTYWMECKNSFEAAIRKFQSEVGINPHNVVVIHDRHIIDHRFLSMGAWSDINGYLKSLGVRIVQYKPEMFNHSTDVATVSLVEKEFLSRMDYLVTAGFGSFQQSLIDLFLYKHDNNTELHRNVCGFNHAYPRFYEG